VKHAADGVNWFFVDEAGDPTFYDRHGALIVGQEGCSPILLLGFIETIETTEPHVLRHAIAALHAELAADGNCSASPPAPLLTTILLSSGEGPGVRLSSYVCIPNTIRSLMTSSKP
jgi:hypothetical protein